MTAPTLLGATTNDAFQTALLTAPATPALQKGDLIIAPFLYQDFGSGGTTLAVSDDASNLYDDEYPLAETNQYWLSLWWAVAKAAAPSGVQVSAALGASRFFSTLTAIAVRSSLGPFAANPANGAPGAAGTNSGVAALPLVLSLAGFIAALLAAPNTATPDAGFSIIATSPSYGYLTLWNPMAAAGTNTAGATFAAGNWAMVGGGFAQPVVGVADPIGFGSEL